MENLYLVCILYSAAVACYSEQNLKLLAKWITWHWTSTLLQIALHWLLNDKQEIHISINNWPSPRTTSVKTACSHSGCCYFWTVRICMSVVKCARLFLCISGSLGTEEWGTPLLRALKISALHFLSGFNVLPLFGPQLWSGAGCVIIPSWWAHGVDGLWLHTGVERCNPPGIHMSLLVCL